MDEGLTGQLVDFLEEVGLNTGKHILTKGNLMISCPFASVNSGHKHKVDSHPSMGLQFGRKGFVYNCFTCKEKGHGLFDFIDKLQKHGLVSVGDETKLVEFMKKGLPSFNVEVEREIEERQRDIEFGSFVKLEKPRNFSLVKARNVSRHLNKIDCEIAKDVRLMFDKDKKQLIFPCYNYQNEFRGVVRRNNRGYYNDVDVEDTLYLEWLIRGKIGIVTEGMFDAIIIYKYLKKHNMLKSYSSVSLFGAEFAPDQIRKLITYFDTLIIMGDNDDAGISLEKHFVKAVDGRVPTYKIEYIGSDPAEIKEKEFMKLIQRPMPYNHFAPTRKKFLQHEW